MRKIIRKSLLYKSGVEYADYCLNHVEGCSHGCTFPCYAMMMKIRCGIVKDYRDWIQPKIVANALELLDNELPRLKDKIQMVHLCFMTDPFMYKQKEIVTLSLKIIERLNQDNIRCSVLTKGVYPKWLKDKRKYGSTNEYGITLVSLDNTFKRAFEPHSAPYVDRINSLKFLSSQGLKTWISMEPYPTPNLVMQNINELLNRIKFVDKIVFGKLNYNTQSSKFKNNKEFYYKCANAVVKFCKQNNIEYHIKFGTQLIDNSNTAKRFFSMAISTPHINATVGT